jgi:CBS domain-containing protein
MQVSSIMSAEIHTVNPGDAVQEAAVLMRSFNVGSLPVCQGSKLIGIITDRDITVRITAAGLSPMQTNVADAMTAGVKVCSETDELDDAARIMEELQVRRLPVLNSEKQLVGIISLADIAERVRDRKLAGEVLHQVCEPPAEGPPD